MMDKKLIALPILIIIGLSVIGVGMAHWSDMIRINGKVEMASLTLAFREIEPPVEYHWKDGVRYPGEPAGKDVATTTSSLDEPITDVHSGKSGFEKMHIKIENAYPCYEVHCTFIVHNIGTMALDITALTITDLTGHLTFTGSGITADPWVGVNPDGKEVINVLSVNLVGEQLEPCQDEKAELDTHLKQDAEECHTYQFVVGIIYEQYDP